MNIDGIEIGYCTNVHAGTTIPQVQENLKQYTLAVKRCFRPHGSMGIGLWLSNQVCQQLMGTMELIRFADWLRANDLVPFTLNGFPYNDFHQSVVKHQVYKPNWADRARLEYTLALAKIQTRLLPEGGYGTISTLPLGWPDDRSPEFFRRCADQLVRCAEKLAELRVETGRHIVLCLEPEPGCLLERSRDVAQFFSQYLYSGNATQVEHVRDHLAVCHDVCHATVMFETQQDALETYRQHGIRLGKIQVSSAIQARFDLISDEEKTVQLGVLRQFAEERYLHQTTIRHGDQEQFYEDLPLALAKRGHKPVGTWRVHFHVPIYAARLAIVETTQAEIFDCLKHVQRDDGGPLHFEIETYAWTVLPPSLQPNSLAQGIARELTWFHDECLVEHIARWKKEVTN